MMSWHQHWVKIRNFYLQASSKWNISVVKSYIISSYLKIKTRPCFASIQVLLNVRPIFFWGGGGGGTSMVAPFVLFCPLLCVYPFTISRCFRKHFLMTPPPTIQLQACFFVNPTPAPNKNFNRRLRQCCHGTIKI